MAWVRLAGIATVAGSACAIVGSLLPWIDATDPASGETFTKAGIEGHYAMLVDLLAAITGGIGGLALVRRRASARFWVAVITLALAQVGLVIFVGSNLSRGVEQLQAAGAVAGIGVGLYLTGLGAAVATAGGILGLRSR